MSQMFSVMLLVAGIGAVLLGCGSSVETSADGLPVVSCTAASLVGSWRVEYAVSASSCQPGNDELVVAMGAVDDPTFQLQGGTVSGTFDSQRCAVEVRSHSSWDQGGEPQSDDRDLTLRFNGDLGVGTLVYSAWWFCGHGEPVDESFDANAHRVQ